MEQQQQQQQKQEQEAVHSGVARLGQLQRHLTRAGLPTSQEMLNLAEERAAASFDTSLMESYFYGSEEIAQGMRQAYQLIQRDPAFYCPPEDLVNFTVVQHQAKAMQQIHRYAEMVRSNGGDERRFALLWRAMSDYSGSFHLRSYVHKDVFKWCIKFSGTDEQKRRWLPDADAWRILGCYAMTELGHSAQLSGLETTATYDRSTDEIIVNTPSLTSSKWMVSGAGETSTHSVVICRLIVDGRPQGLEWFIVPLRSRSTGRPLPGVVVGNIGTKGGLHGLDNGWIQFNQVRIPRENMLMRWSQLDANGVYTPAAHPAFAYVALISERLSITATANRNYACALTIAVRYCCARRQGRRNEQLLDYTIQQQRLMPGIASLYVYSLAVLQFQAEWQQLLDEAYEQPEKHATLFPAAHGLSSGLKSTISWWGSNVLESCRRACGAHAYSEYNGLTIWIKETSPLTSGGGDSTLLGQLAAKFLLTSLRKAAAGERLVGAVAYLNDMDRILANPPQHDRPTGHFTSPDILLKMLTWISVRQICTMAELLTVSDNVDPEDRWNELQADLVIATNMHVQRHSLQNFLVHIRSTSAHDQYASLQPVLERCATLFALQCVREHLAAFLEFGYFSSADAEAVRTAFREMCLALRQDALPLVDAWAFPDFVLKSGVGRYDGDAYQGFFNLLRQSPNCCGVPSYWQDHIRPLTHPDAE